MKDNKTSRVLSALFFGTFVSLVVVAGCGGRETGVVSGRVTFDGKPIKDYNVTFDPLLPNNRLGEESSGLTDADGRYTLVLADAKKSGAEVGKCRVHIVWRDPDPYPDGKEHPAPYKLPAAASDGSLEFVVPKGGTDEADFDF